MTAAIFLGVLTLACTHEDTFNLHFGPRFCSADTGPAVHWCPSLDHVCNSQPANKTHNTSLHLHGSVRAFNYHFPETLTKFHTKKSKISTKSLYLVWLRR